MSNNKLVEEIKERLSIEEVVSSYIKLEKTGINFKTRCPFHNEKTPSFFVSPDRGSFYCFGCNKGGDIFTFIQEIENVSFLDALKILADKAGLDISKYKIINNEKITENNKNVLYEILEKATLFFQKRLEENQETKKYLKNRGINEESIKKFRIGFAKNEWHELLDFLKKEGYSESSILKTGLIVKNENDRLYDRFRDRIIFPIFDEKGKVVAYSARILKEKKDEPKYINSPETELFNKSKILYGFNFAKQIIRKHDFAILVEGQIDVIMTHQIGYTNTVASSGTSFTEEQLKLIKRYTKNLLISFDADNAGVKSSKKVWELALQNEMEVKVIPIEGKKDPAELIFQKPDDWKKIVKNSQHIIEYLSEHIYKNFSDIRKRQKEVQIEIYPYLRNIRSYTDKSYFIEKLSDLFDINKDAIWNDISVKENNNQNVEGAEDKKEFTNPKEILFGIYYNKNINNPDDFLNLIKKYISDDMITEMEKRKEKIILKSELLFGQYETLRDFVEDILKQVILIDLEEKKNKIIKEIKELKDNSQQEKIKLKNLTNIKIKMENVKKGGCHNLLNMI